MLRLIVIFILFTSNSFSKDNIVSVNINFILQNSKQGKQLLSSLEKIEKEKIKNLESKYTSLKEKENSLLIKKEIMAKEKFDNELNKLRNDIKIYNENKKSTLDDINTVKKKKISEFLSRINDQILDYAKNNDVFLVLDKKNIIMIKNDYDITSVILEKFND